MRANWSEVDTLFVEFLLLARCQAGRHREAVLLSDGSERVYGGGVIGDHPSAELCARRATLLDCQIAFFSEHTRSQGPSLHRQ